MFQKLHQKHNRDKIMIHPLVFTAYFTEHCNSLTSSSNIQTCTNTTDRVPLPAFVIFLKFLLMSVCKMKILINLYTKVPGVLMVYSRCIPFVQFGKLKMWDGILFQLSLSLIMLVLILYPQRPSKWQNGNDYVGWLSFKCFQSFIIIGHKIQWLPHY